MMERWRLRGSVRLHGVALALAAWCGSAVSEGVADDVVELPPMTVTPDASNPWRAFDRSLWAARRSLPGLGTEDLARKRDMPERLLDALGLSGAGVQGLSASEQEALRAFCEQLEGQW